MVGIAVATMVLSTAAMNRPIMTAAVISGRRRAEAWRVVSSGAA